MTINPRGVTHLTFDCYGTIVDWETGILAALRGVLAAHDRSADDRQILTRYARHEADAEAGEYLRYADVLKSVLTGLGSDFGFRPTEVELQAFSRSVPEWPPFPDSREALLALQSRFKLVILSNVDDDLFAGTQARIGIEFDEIITAEQVRSYKPATRNFRYALDRLAIEPGQLVHVAQSLFHDHAPAKALGWKTVWVNRASRLRGTGVALPAVAEPDAEVPDLTSLARLLGAA